MALRSISVATAQEASTTAKDEGTASAGSAPAAQATPADSSAGTSAQQPAATSEGTGGTPSQESAQPAATAGGGSQPAPAADKTAAPSTGDSGTTQQSGAGASAQGAPASANQSAPKTAADSGSGSSGSNTGSAQQAAPQAATAPAAQGAAAPAGEQKASDQKDQKAAAASDKTGEAAKKGTSESEKVLKNQEKPPEQDTGLQSLGINLISNKIQMDITESYLHTTNNQLYIDGFGVIPILVVGNVSVQQVRRDAFTTTAALRYKVTDKLQAEVRIPWTYTIIRHSEPTGLSSNAVVNPTQDTMGYSNGVGDISVGVNYSMKNEGLSSPSLLGGLTFKGRNGRDVFESPNTSLKPPIGSGFFSLGGSLSASKTSAPAIVYGSVGYNYAFPRYNVVFTPANQPPFLVNFVPGNNFNLSMGVAISLNYNFTLNMSYAQSVNFSSQINGRKLANSATDAITLRIGGTWRFTTKSSVDVGVSFGVTPDAPDFRLDMRFPFKFGNA